MAESDRTPENCDVVVVGAGATGLYAIHKLTGLGFSVICLERGDGVGGTWYWNRYPGARCDVDSLDYSFSFDSELEQEWEWTERYPTQPELLRYFNHVADRFDLRRHIRFETTVTAGEFDEAEGRWTVRTDRGDVISAQHYIAGVGTLSTIIEPPFPGLDTFTGDWYQTSRWPQGGVDVTGKRVLFIGTGSTGIQAIPQIAQDAEQVTVFQRTPNFSLPAQNAPLDPAFQRSVKDRYPDIRQASRESAFGQGTDVNERSATEMTADEARAELDKRWNFGGAIALLTAFPDVLISAESNGVAADYVRDKIRSRVDDPEIAELLCPTNHPIGTKRPCVDIDYYEVYNRDNVTLVDIRDRQIEAITETGLRLTDGQAFEDFDTIIFAIGFDAMTGSFLKLNLTGRGGETLDEKWADGPHTYLGLMVAGFPNLYMVTGPQSPSVLSNMMISIEQHIDLITDTIVHMRDHGEQTIEATQEAQDSWTAHCNELAAATLLPQGNSWWMGRNVPGKPTTLLPYAGGVGLYRQQCDRVVENGYEGFAFDGEPVPLAGEHGTAVAMAVGG